VTFGRWLPRLVLAGAVLGCGAPGYQGPTTPHFDGERFKNEARIEQAGLLGVLKWQVTAKAVPWGPDREITAAKPERNAPPGAVRVTFVNHATVLVQVGTINVLTDPVWSERVGPLSFAGPQRHKGPGIRFQDLPPIDAVVISHNHYDHCDFPTLRALAQAHHPVILGGLGTKAMLDDAGIPGGAEADWWQSIDLPAQRGRITITPSQHWSRRGFFDQNNTLWGSYMIEADGKRVYFAGDTGYGAHFGAVAQKVGKPDVALLPIGAYEPRWFMAPSHMAPRDAVQAHLDLGAKQSMGIHWGTFDLADEGQYEPVGQLGLSLDAQGLPRGAFVAPDNGGVLEVR
jgi:L-ascorbate metabolism protein UlaG (beta-lactamase superfamily)